MTHICYLYRNHENHAGTWGAFVGPSTLRVHGKTVVTTDGWQGLTLELPWRKNAPQYSCIPPGRYSASYVLSPRLDKHYYRLYGVPKRTEILIHPFNHAGDVTRGYHCESEGCIALGQGIGYIYGQLGVIGSMHAEEQMHIAYEEADLIIDISHQEPPGLRKKIRDKLRAAATMPLKEVEHE